MLPIYVKYSECDDLEESDGGGGGGGDTISDELM